MGCLKAAAVCTWYAAASSQPLEVPSVAMQTSIEGTGLPLILLAGSPGGAAAFAPHAARLAATYRVVRLQTLNVQFAIDGRLLPEDYSVAVESHAMRHALDALGLTGSVDVIGWSYGALIALDFALNHPERIRSLVLAEPPAFWVVGGEDAMDAGMREIRAILQGFGPRSEISEEQLERFLCALGNCPPGRSIREDPRWPGWVQERERLRHGSAVAAHQDDPARLGTFRQPVLIVTGAATVPFHRRINEGLAARLPQVQRAELPGGHAAPRMAMEQFVQVLTAFLAGRP
jgi:pimeloyl-ACP methyl ester carboxylesterase